VPANRQRHLVELGLGDVSLPVAEQMAREVISLPVHPQLSQAELETIVTEVNKL
jgi:dTDP-4-amino-4,6-dideoxygalactose transaminase